MGHIEHHLETQNPGDTISTFARDLHGFFPSELSSILATNIIMPIEI